MRSLFGALLFITAMPVGAMDTFPGEEKFANLMGQDATSGGIGLGLTNFGDGDYFVQVSPRVDFSLGGVGIGLQIPLNLRIWDADPKASGDHFGLIREEDWDEPSEFLKAIRKVRLGRKTSKLYISGGELSAEIGHGTILGNYINNVDIETFRAGAHVAMNVRRGGFEVLVSDIGTVLGDNPHSQLVGFRGYIRPSAFFYDKKHLYDMFAIGLTAVMDLNAPLQLQMENGVAVVQDGRFVPQTIGTARVLGVDVEARVLQNPLLDLMPYIDVNSIKDVGGGVHVGVKALAKLPIGLDLKLPVRLEYRWFPGSSYAPQYFSTFYELERYQMGAAAKPKLQLFLDKEGGLGANGIYGDLAFDFIGLAQLGLIYEDYQGAEPNVSGFLKVPALDAFKFKAYYQRRGVEGLDDVFTLDEKSLAAVEGRYQIIADIYAVARWSRRWQLDDATGSYVAEDETLFNVEYSFDF
ncbi:MAG: hypothetical protein VX405_10165 [Myxococcota bacterium]|nr:hypothetical protein [Myxococcales bacterium]MEC7751857.1 hypothetical protein [Myxococcota bacterium]